MDEYVFNASVASLLAGTTRYTFLGVESTPACKSTEYAETLIVFSFSA